MTNINDSNTTQDQDIDNSEKTVILSETNSVPDDKTQLKPQTNHTLAEIENNYTQQNTISSPEPPPQLQPNFMERGAY